MFKKFLEYLWSQRSDRLSYLAYVVGISWAFLHFNPELHKILFDLLSNVTRDPNFITKLGDAIVPIIAGVLYVIKGK